MPEIKLANLPRMSVNKLVERLSDVYVGVIKKNLPLRSLPSVMLWGPPGVGKSQAIRQIAAKIEEDCHKKVVITDVRLLLFNPIDLRGIPTANAEKTAAVWLKPKIFQMDESSDVINLLFLDELTAAPQSVQAAAYQITLDRKVGEHQLPENCIVIAAGNRTTDKSVSFKMPKALANRLLHIEIEGHFDAWCEWAKENGINEKVIGFLQFRKKYLISFDVEDEDLAFATPRSWEMVSTLLNTVSDDVDKLFPMIAGLVGSGIAVEFRTWVASHYDIPSVKIIFAGGNPPLPEEPSALYALIGSMKQYAAAHRDDLVAVAHSIKYARKMPEEFFAVLMREYMAIEKSFKKKLMKIDIFSEWYEKKGRLIDEIITG